MLAGPGRCPGLDPVLRAADAWKPGDQFGSELHGVEMPPATFLGVVGDAALAAALRTSDRPAAVDQADLYPLLLHFEVHRLHPPGVVEAEQSSVVFAKRFHASFLRHRSRKQNSVDTTEFPEEPKKEIGLPCGLSSGPFEEVVSKPGYAVGGVECRSGALMDGLVVVFMKLKDGRLNRGDVYRSRPFG